MSRRSHSLLPTPLASLPAFLLAFLLLGPFWALAQEEGWDIEVRVPSSADDSEEFLAGSSDDPQRWPAGFSYSESSDLELGRDASHARQIVGLRFPDLPIPPGATIEQAVIEFTADTDQAEPLSVAIRVQDSVDAAPFIQDQDGQGSFDLTSRTTASSVQTWRPDAWSSGASYTTPDLAGLLQPLVDSAEWQAGGDVVFLFSPAGEGDGLRTAYAHDNDAQRAPRLLISLGGDAAVTEPPAETEGASPEEAADGRAANEAVEPAEPAEAEEPEEAESTEPAEEPAAPEGEPADDPADEPLPVPEAEPEPAPEPEEEPAAAEEPAPEEPATEEPPTQGVEVRPVDPDPIVIPESREENGPAVWPGPTGIESEGVAQAQEEEEEAAPEPEQVVPDAPAEAEAAEAEAAEPAEAEPTVQRDAPRRQRYGLTPNFAGGLRGSVLLSDYGGGVTVVTVFLDNPDPRVTYAASLRQGECGAGGPLTVDLQPIAGDQAFSTSLLSLAYDELTGGGYNVTIRRTAGEFVRVVACAGLANQ